MTPSFLGNTSLSFAFFGTPDVASETLELLHAGGYTPSLIITAPDRPVGRHFTLTPSPVKTWALEHDIPFIQPEKLTAEVVAEIGKLIQDHAITLSLVVAYGKIMPESLIELPELGTINIHYSLLPKYRGASPVESAVLHGDSETGIAIQQMVYALDAGAVLAERKISIDPDETAPALRKRLITLGGELLVETLPFIINGTARAHAREQDHTLATKCGKIKKEDGHINPFTDDPETLWNKYRAYYGWPGLYFFDEDNKRIKITRARLERNPNKPSRFIIEKVIPEGKKEIDWNNPL